MFIGIVKYNVIRVGVFEVNLDCRYLSPGLKDPCTSKTRTNHRYGSRFSVFRQLRLMENVLGKTSEECLPT